MSLETLSENTKKIRRSLLAASLVGYSISVINVSISKITVFGTEFKIGNFQAIPFVLGLIVLYFLITFIVYALSEYAHLHREGKKEYLSTLSSPVPMALREAEEEVLRLGKVCSELSILAQYETDKRQFYEKEIELRKMENIVHYLKKTNIKFFDRFSFMNIRFVVELIFPIAVGISACIMVFFFTEFKVETPKAAKTAITIKTEKVVIQTQQSNTEKNQYPKD